jgi:tetratricopeptide (TPR) repeat protein
MQRGDMRRLFVVAYSLAGLLLFAEQGAAAAKDENLAAMQRYARNGFSAVQRGDWDKAREGFGKALESAQKTDATDRRTMAVLYLEYGRALGVSCQFEEAGAYLERAREVDEVAGGPVHMSLVELARLKRAEHEFEEAELHYRTVMPMLAKHSIPTVDPIGYAQFLEEYADVLRQIGKGGNAIPLDLESQELRVRNPGKSSQVSVTPYGEHCN